MKLLVTGAAGFIGFHASKKLLELGHEVVGLDNINSYYDINLKFDRLKELGVNRKNSEEFNYCCKSSTFSNFRFYRMNLEDKAELQDLFINEKFDVVCNLAAQAGVRYSLENPDAYVQSNIVGFLNILECCRSSNIKHLVYASSSSVYGDNSKIPFSEEDRVDNPISLYAATKKSNELMAHTYSHLYQIPTTGLRFFTVYGPWGRPDMAPSLFAEAISAGNPIKVFNYGNMERDFTFIDDIVDGIIKVIQGPKNENYQIFNIGNNKSVKLMSFIRSIEKELGIKADMKMMPIQKGDVQRTWANCSMMVETFGYNPTTNIEEGVRHFIQWFKNYK